MVHTLGSKWDEEGKKQFQMDWKTEQRCCARTTPLSRRVIRGLLSFFFFFFRGDAKEDGFIECLRTGKDRFQCVI